MEINRIEADRHLIGVGRELESLDGKAKAAFQRAEQVADG